MAAAGRGQRGALHADAFETRNWCCSWSLSSQQDQKPTASQFEDFAARGRWSFLKGWKHRHQNPPANRRQHPATARHNDNVRVKKQNRER
jgi:hypothetical protein